MSDHSSIEWTDATWNVVTGCTKCAAGCAYCYIDRTPPFRINGRKFVNGSTDIQFHPDRLCWPLGWRKPRRIFVNSLSDLFHDAVPFELIAAMFGVMAACPQHTFQILTKRPKRAIEFFRWLDEREGLAPRYFCHLQACDGVGRSIGPAPDVWPPPNVWIGTSVFCKQLGANVRDRNDAGFEGDLETYEDEPTAWTNPSAWPHQHAAEDRIEHLDASNWQGAPVRVHLKDRKGGNWNEWPADLRIRQFPKVAA